MARRRVRDLCPGESHPGPKVPDWQQHRSPTPDLGRTMGRGRTFGTRAGGVETIAFGWAQIAVRCNMICGVISEDLRRLTMTQTPEKTESRWAELSDEVLESVEASRKQAIDAIRKFVDQVSGEIPDQARRKNVIDAALDLTEELVTGRIEFFRSVVRSAGEMVGGKQS